MTPPSSSPPSNRPPPGSRPPSELPDDRFSEWPTASTSRFGSIPSAARRSFEDYSLADLEAIRLLLRGGSIIDWHRLNFSGMEEVHLFLRAHEIAPEEAADMARAEAVKNAAISYLRRNFDFPIPKAVATMALPDLLMLASGKGHRQLCACTILKVMHVIHHMEARELLFTLPISDEDVFHLVETKVYRVIGDMLARGFPIVEFIGGRKNKDSLYTKLMSKPEVTAAQIYDKLRFRIVTREPDDVFAILRHLVHHVFPFNYVIPGESTNTIFNFRSFCDSFPALEKLTHQTQFPVNFEDHEANKMENAFSSSSYRVVHFVVDMPIRLPEAMVRSAPPAAWALGPVIFSQTEFQILDHQNDRDNEMGPASHDAYKQRQKLAVMRRLKLGRGNRRTATSQATDMMATDYSGSDEASLSDPEEKASQDASSDEE